MRIARVIGVLEPGGAQLSMLRLARAQSALGVETRLLAGDATPLGVTLARHYGCEPEVMRMHDQVGHSTRQWTPDPAFARWLASTVTSVDLVHAHMFGAWWAAAAALPAGMPLVASEHNALTWPLGDHTDAAAAVADRIDLFFAHAPDPTEVATALGIRRARVRPGRSGISSLRAPRPGLASPRLTFTGRLRADKGPDLLLHALAGFTNPPPTYLVGDGPMHRQLQRQVNDLGLARVVRMPGWSHEPARYVAGSAVHVVPSREEAWSQSAVTALALGVPVVATNVDGLKVTLAQRRGLLVDPRPEAIAAGIQAVLDGRVRIDTAGGRAYAAAFEPSLVAAYYFAAYQQVLSGHPRSVRRGRSAAKVIAS